ncbi:ankyrin repeat-containing domain protein [Truncatella angustata]|uniref:Ankyrin repeat-containing domain protein n=1 Tax=Truncatella angustata TaxID=152316 RepID=A0A9P8RK17_9PEZI|nr:ankyrin repeat-containing domain protein [Truncatella angustata]KAH6640046.1 ankyrin repeat-containing domain protein [Truncatella angustata]
MLEALYLARPEYETFALTMRDAVIAVYRQMAVDGAETVQDFVLRCNDVHLNALKVYAGMASPTEISAVRVATLKLSDTHLMIYMEIDTILVSARGSLGSMRQLVAPFDWTPLHSAVLTECVETVKFVLGKSGDVNAPLGDAARYTLTPLHLAVVFGRVKFVEVLLKVQGADVRTRDYGKFGVTPSHTCADFKSAEHLEILSILLAHDSTLVRARDENNHTSLHHAALRENLPAVKLLIQHGAEVDALDDRESTPLHLAYMRPTGGRVVV